MGWLIFAIFAVAATFVATYMSSGDIWDAMFTAAIPVCIYLAGLLLHATRQAVTPRQRALILSCVAIVCVGVAGHWAVMHSMTRWQHQEIVSARDRIERSMMMSTVYDRATPIFAAFHEQQFPENRSMAEVFQDTYPGVIEKGSVVLLDSLDGGVKVYAKCVWNTTVVLTAVGGLGRGLDPEFRNIDGRNGFLQTSLRLTPEGLVYESQN